MGPVKRAHLLLEPYLGYYLCRSIVDRMRDKSDIVASWKRRGWCAVQAMSVYFLVYGPKAARQQGYHESIHVNQVECAAYAMEAGEEDRSEVSGQSCSRHRKPGQNTITLGVYERHDSFNYSRHEWRLRDRAYHLKNVTNTQTRRGRKLYGNSITCVQR